MSYLRDALIEIGLSPLQATVYLALLEHGETTAGSLAKITGLKRPTVYLTLDELKEQGLASESKKEKTKIFNAQPIEFVRNLIQTEEKELKEKMDTFNQIRTALQDLQNKRLPSPKINIFEGKNGVLSLLLQSLWENPPEIFVFGNWESFKEDYQAHTERRIEAAIPLKIIAPDTAKSRTMAKLDKESFRETRVVDPKTNAFPGAVLAYGSEVILLSLDQPQPVGVQIVNEKIAQTLKEIFRLAFARAKRIKS